MTATSSSASTMSTLSVLSYESLDTDTDFKYFKNPFNQLYNSVQKVKLERNSGEDFPVPSPNSLLLQLLRPLLTCSKLLGVFPVKFLRNGSLQYFLLSFASLYSFIFLGVHIAISGSYLMFMHYVLSTVKGGVDNLNYYAQMVFMVGQCAAGLVAMVSGHFMARPITRLWNELQRIASAFGTQGEPFFRRTCIIGRISLFMWVILSIIYGSFGVIYFWSYLSEYYNKDSNPFFFFHSLFFSIFFIQMSCHLLPSMVYISICRIIQNCHTALASITPSQTQDFKSFVRLYNTYSSLEDICSELGEIYGFYLIVEMILTISSSLVNIYFCIFISSNFHKGFSVAIPPSMILFNAVWLYSTTNAGERVHKEAAYTKRALRNAAVYNLSPRTNIQIQGLLVALSAEHAYISASRFFKVNRRLITKVAAMMTTYLIFLVQFRTDLKFDQNQTPNNCTNQTFTPY